MTTSYTTRTKPNTGYTTIARLPDNLLSEDGFGLLIENSSQLLIESSSDTSYTIRTKPNTSYTSRPSI